MTVGLAHGQRARTIARGDTEIAALKRDAMAKEGLKEAINQAGFRGSEEKLDGEIDDETAQRYRLHHPHMTDHLFVCR
jgi:hypothetical protein